MYTRQPQPHATQTDKILWNVPHVRAPSYVIFRTVERPQVTRLKPVWIRQKYFSRFQDTTDALPRHIHLPVCLCIMDPHSRAPKKNSSHGKEVLPQDTTLLVQRPYYQRGSPCQDLAGNRTTRRPPDHRKETQMTW